ncbi:MAG: PspC domain-containing protein [Chloroflexi bacterium]|nr:PspC domain-containing protein [Chloroflexota bacterium]
MERRLYRSESDQMLSGVSGGLAEYFDIDPVIVRLLWVILTIFSGGLLIVVYGAFWIVMPTYSSIYGDEPEERDGVVDLEPEDGDEEDENDNPGTGDSESNDSPERPAGAAEQPAAVAPARRSRRGSTRRLRRRRLRRGQTRVVIGAVLVIVGGIALLNNFLPFYDPWRLWPLILVGIGLAILAGRLSNGR